MFLNIFDAIRQFFQNLFSKISFSSVITLLFGVLIGILICFIVYLITLLNSIKKEEEKNRIKGEEIKEVSVETIRSYIDGKYDEYKEYSNDLNVGQKFALAKDLALELSLDIAKLYYPKSNHPMFELSPDELIKLNHYITERIESIIDGSIFKYFKKVKISRILNILDTRRKINDNKIVKSAKKMHIGGIIDAVKSAVNILNPAYYLKKGATSLTLNIGFDKIVYIVYEIIGEEIAKIYSKRVFVLDSKIDEVIKSIEEDMIDEKEEKKGE